MGGAGLDAAWEASGLCPSRLCCDPPPLTFSSPPLSHESCWLHGLKM